jgi:acetyltransferase
MTIRNLEYMLKPRSVALIGASPEEGSVGCWLARNILRGGFEGAVHFVNPKHSTIEGHPCLPAIANLPDGVDLAVIATPARTVPAIMEELAAKSVKTVVCITAGLDDDAKQRILEAGQPTLMRVLGPNCIGLLLPLIGLNASFAHCAAPPGDLAFVSQSGALVTAILDWASPRNVGFSHILSVGDMADVDFGDLLDYLAADTESRAILLYMEAVTHAPKFMSAARRAARVKPVVIVKSGRNEAAAKAAMSHTGALAGSDAAYDAAFRRAGMLRVMDLEQLFEAAEILSIAPRLKGERLMILTNGGGAGVLASDRLADLSGTLAPISDETRAALDEVLPPGWSHGNPVDIIGDGGPERYRKAMEILLADRDSDALLVINCPTALASSKRIAETVLNIASSGSSKKPILTNWLGEASARDSRALFAERGIPTFETPGSAVRGFMHLVRYNRAQAELMRTPRESEAGMPDDTELPGEIIAAALKSGRTTLSAFEAKEILAACGVPMAQARFASDVAAASSAAAELLRDHDAVALKIHSDDLSHKSDVGGVKLGLDSAQAVEDAASAMLERISKSHPDARLEGFTIEPMVVRRHGIELIAGVNVDRTFGPMILFGAGGTAVEVMKDTSMALLPLDTNLAHDLMKRTRIHALLEGYRDRPPADFDAITRALINLGNLAIAHPAIREIDINPLVADENGVIGLDARMRIADPEVEPRVPLAIRPYPSKWETEKSLADLGRVLLRPVRPQDEPLATTFATKLTQEDIRLRLFSPRKDFSHAFMARLTQIDYAREMAFVAIHEETGELLGVSRLIADPDYVRAEYGIIVRSDLKGKGLGWELMQHLLAYARAEGLRELFGTVLAENAIMLKMCEELGFDVRRDPEDMTLMHVSLDLQAGH